VLINGYDALEWKPSPSPHAKGKQPSRPPHVSFTRTYEEIDAYTAMGLTAAEYHALPGTPEWADEESGGMSKCDVIIWRQYNRVLSNLDRGIF
jgi:hypothetical protein